MDQWSWADRFLQYLIELQNLLFMNSLQFLMEQIKMELKNVIDSLCSDIAISKLGKSCPYFE
jgi:hypothetical protein